jgi:hypothetical protein
MTVQVELNFGGLLVPDLAIAGELWKKRDPDDLQFEGRVHDPNAPCF